MSMSEQSHSAGTHPGLFGRFLHSEVFGSVILLGCTLIALVWANSPWSDAYSHILHTKVGISWGGATHALTVHHWINDGLMVIFFFVVGLEIKRELLIGRLSSIKKAMMPVMAAVGGMVVPAMIYAVLNAGGDGARGWGVPMATDIAFSLGMLAVLGSRVPTSLKIFLTAAAIADDLGAVLVIALFYAETTRIAWLFVAMGFLAALYVVMRVLHIRRLGILLPLIFAIWIAVFASGIHATVAGILVALLVPIKPVAEPRRLLDLAEDRVRRLRGADPTAESMVFDHEQLEAAVEAEDAVHRMQPPGLRLEHYWHPVQAFLILPLFALANAGVRLDQGVFQAVASPVGLGIILGLFLGKQAGFMLFSWLAIRLGRADLPEGVTWMQFWGMSCLAGIGFTMSLFVTELAFTSESLIASAKIGILVASLVSAVAGYVVLHFTLPRQGRSAEDIHAG
jgi:NhaA family Na+:H+ antiporter